MSVLVVKEQPITKAEMRAIANRRSQEMHSCQDTRRCKHRRMLIAFSLMLLSICAILFVYCIVGEDVGIPIWKRYGDSYGSQPGFVRNKLWIIILVLGLLACVLAAIFLSACCCRKYFDNPLCCPCYPWACCDGLGNHFAACHKLAADLGVKHACACTRDIIDGVLSDPSTRFINADDIRTLLEHGTAQNYLAPVSVEVHDACRLFSLRLGGSGVLLGKDYMGSTD